MKKEAVILSAEDVRRLVMEEEWCPPFKKLRGDFDNLDEQQYAEVCDETKPPLFTRCPGCQPEGLICPAQYDGDLARSYIWQLNGHNISTSAAIDLILMSIARDGKKAFITPPQAIQQKYYDCLVDAVMSTDLPGAVSARHRLKDLENGDGS